MEKLRDYLNSLTMAEQLDLAERCGTSRGHMRNMVYGNATCSPELAIAIERESLGDVKVEELCRSADWAYIRGTRKRPVGRKPSKKKSKAG
jgi:DNA-binding transcriptional regulator YdaS (Cro superfamily)